MVNSAEWANLNSDLIAQTLSWEPAKSGGANYKTHSRVDDAVQIRFVPSLSAHLTCLLISLFFSYFVYLYFTDRSSINFDMPSFLIPFVPYILIGVIIFTLYEVYKPRVFNLEKKIYRYSWFKPEIEISHLDSRYCIHFSEIHALQVLDELIEDDDGDYTSTELNLVLKDGQRMNVIDHSDRDTIIQDAKFLSRKLIVPVWYQDADRIKEYQPLSTT